MIRVSELKLPVTGNQKALEKKLAKALRVPVEEIKAYRIFKRSLDARKKDNIHYAYVVDAEVKNENKILEKNKDKHISKTPDLAYHLPKGENRPTKRPVVVGFGPAGMFAALLLAEMGLQPLYWSVAVMWTAASRRSIPFGKQASWMWKATCSLARAAQVLFPMAS